VLENRSMPADVLVPVLSYPSVGEAVEWLTRAFGFTLRWQVGDHRAQLGVGESAAIAIAVGEATQSADHVMVRVEDVDAHRERAESAGAEVGEVGEFPFGERQYTAVDFSGRQWVFTQTVADVDPAVWGARHGLSSAVGA
jgi:uncharacterized glyoxalase superfamily protein PhnB